MKWMELDLKQTTPGTRKRRFYMKGSSLYLESFPLKGEWRLLRRVATNRGYRKSVTLLVLPLTCTAEEAQTIASAHLVLTDTHT